MKFHHQTGWKTDDDVYIFTIQKQYDYHGEHVHL